MNSNHIATAGVILMIAAAVGGIYWNKTYVAPSPVTLTLGDEYGESVFEKALKDNDVSYEYVTAENAERIVALYRRKETKIRFNLKGTDKPGHHIYFIRRSNSQEYAKAWRQYKQDLADQPTARPTVTLPEITAR